MIKEMDKRGHREKLLNVMLCLRLTGCWAMVLEDGGRRGWVRLKK